MGGQRGQAGVLEPLELKGRSRMPGNMRQVQRKWERTQRHWDDRHVLHRRQATPLMILRWKITAEKAARAVHRVFQRERRLLTVLDIGCGRGEFYHSVAPWVKRYVGADPSDLMIPKSGTGDGETGGRGDKRSRGQVKSFVKAVAEKLPGTLKSFDVAIFKESLDHCYDDCKALRQAHRVLRSGGTLIITMNNRSSWYKRLFKKTTERLEQQHQDHFVFFDILGLLARLEGTGFRVTGWQTYHFLKLPESWERFLGPLFPVWLWRLKFSWNDILFRLFMPRSGGAMIVTAEKK